MSNDNPNRSGPAPSKYHFGYEAGVDNGFDFQKPNQPYIVDLVTLARLTFQTIPPEISVNPEATWVVISAAGRNGPLYQYTGGEDTLEFTLSWYANTDNLDDVIKKCKWIESLSRNDGYTNKPHPIKFVFGELFKKSTFIVHGAPYRLSNFDRVKGMMPTLATQSIALKRVDEGNRSRADILNINT